MKKVSDVAEAVNSSVIPPGSRIYCGGNAATPQLLLRQLADDPDIKDIDLYCVLLLGAKDNLRKLFSTAACKPIMEPDGVISPLFHPSPNDSAAR